MLHSPRGFKLLSDVPSSIFCWQTLSKRLKLSGFYKRESGGSTIPLNFEKNTHGGGEESGWKKWRPYGDSNPGYRRERAVS